MRAIDLTGQQFGGFLVLGRDPLDRQKWTVKCDKGHVTSRYGRNLKSQKALSCRQCLDDKIPKWKYNQILQRMKTRFGDIDLSMTPEFLLGMYFSQNKKCALSNKDISFSSDPRKITASLDRIDSSKGYTIDNVQWVHKDINFIKRDLTMERFFQLCSLVANYKKTGSKKIAREPFLPKKKRHTGKINYRNMVGEKFGELTVIGKHFLEKRSYPSHCSWIVQCSCGNVRAMPACALTCKEVTTCRLCADRRHRLNGNGIPSHFYSSILRNARKRNLTFDTVKLSKKRLFSLLLEQDRKCALTGVDIALAATNIAHDKGDTTASLDRIKSTIGYTRENVQWVHKDVNMMKQGFSEDYFKDVCRAVCLKLQSKLPQQIQRETRSAPET